MTAHSPAHDDDPATSLIGNRELAATTARREAAALREALDRERATVEDLRTQLDASRLTCTQLQNALGGQRGDLAAAHARLDATARELDAERALRRATQQRKVVRLADTIARILRESRRAVIGGSGEPAPPNR